MVPAVKPTSRSQRNDAYGADTGPSRGDACRRAIRPTEAFKAAVCYVRNTSTPTVCRREFHPQCDNLGLLYRYVASQFRHDFGRAFRLTPPSSAVPRSAHDRYKVRSGQATWQACFGHRPYPLAAASLSEHCPSRRPLDRLPGAKPRQHGTVSSGKCRLWTSARPPK